MFLPYLILGIGIVASLLLFRYFEKISKFNSK